MDELLSRHRTNTTTVLALATGAATFSGFSNSPKGVFFVLSLGAYAVATFLAVAIYGLPIHYSWLGKSASEGRRFRPGVLHRILVAVLAFDEPDGPAGE